MVPATNQRVLFTFLSIQLPNIFAVVTLLRKFCTLAIQLPELHGDTRDGVQNS